MKKVLLRKGVIGIDEVGRGPLAGPVTVCAFYVEDEKRTKKYFFENIIRDSKKVNKDFRNNIYRTILQNRKIKNDISYAISSRSAEYIDAYGIVNAVSTCVRSCLIQLQKKGIDVSNTKIRLDAGIVLENHAYQDSFVKGDERFVEIALASIMAKVARDRYMTRLGNNYSFYGWDKNVGYGTKAHRDAISKYGITKYHRKSFLKAFKLFDKAE